MPPPTPRPATFPGRATLLRLSLAGTLSVLMYAPTAVGAAQPVPGWYGGCNGSSCEVSFKVTSGGRVVSSFFAGIACGPAPVYNMRISRSGEFGFHGRRGIVWVAISGRFTSRARASGTVLYRRGRCDSRAVHWAASLDRT
jgi:hypothetical protein